MVYASLILDRLTFHVSKDFNLIIAPEKATKQSTLLKCAYVFIHKHLHNLSPDGTGSEDSRNLVVLLSVFLRRDHSKLMCLL